MYTKNGQHYTVKKGWGCEVWFINNEHYCGKFLEVKKGFKCSYHFHHEKDEHFVINKGKILLRYSFDDDITKANTLILEPGDSFHIDVGLRHQFEGLEDSVIVEFSMHHEDSDSFRIIKGD